MDQPLEHVEHPAYTTLIGRAWRLRCPYCGQGRMFRGLIRMHTRCDQCGFRFERDPGFFLGSIYVNYGLTAMITTISFVVLRFGFQIDGKQLLIPFSIFCVLFPIFFFRYARALWLAMDCHIDTTSFEDEARNRHF